MKYQQCEPWEAMKAASEGKRIARGIPGNGFSEIEDPMRIDYMPHSVAYALIIEPSFSWDDFDWEFFASQRGLTVLDRYGAEVDLCRINGFYDQGGLNLCKTGWYAWMGGECPVPGNVEVETVSRIYQKAINKAEDLSWNCDQASYDIIHFRLTGEVCDE